MTSARRAFKASKEFQQAYRALAPGASPRNDKSHDKSSRNNYSSRIGRNRMRNNSIRTNNGSSNNNNIHNINNSSGGNENISSSRSNTSNDIGGEVSTREPGQGLLQQQQRKGGRRSSILGRVIWGSDLRRERESRLVAAGSSLTSPRPPGNY